IPSIAPEISSNTAGKPFTSLRSFESFSPRARRGKISRLPETIRSQLNQRLRDGQPGSKILPWLNSLPEVQEACREYFGGQPINHRNLTSGRHTGFDEEEQSRKETSRLTDLAFFASEHAQATGQPLANTAMAFANAKICQMLDPRKNFTEANKENEERP